MKLEVVSGDVGGGDSTYRVQQVCGLSLFSVVFAPLQILLTPTLHQNIPSRRFGEIHRPGGQDNYAKEAQW